MPGSRKSLPKAVVFDLDGTLVDSAPDLQVALNKLLAEEGRRPVSLAEVHAMIGDGVAKLVERGLAATGEAVTGPALDRRVDRFMAVYEGHATDLTRPYPGAMDALAYLKDEGVALGLCTNKLFRATEEVLRGMDLAPYFSAVVGGDSLDGVRKPDPRLLLAVLERLGVEPADAAMVGDSQNDAACAHGAATRLVLVTFGYTRVPVTELGADALIDRLDELPEALRRLP